MRKVGYTDTGILIEVSGCDMDKMFDAISALDGLKLELSALAHNAAATVPPVAAELKPEPIKAAPPPSERPMPKAARILPLPVQGKGQRYATKQCMICSEPFAPVSPIQKTCGDACRNEKDRLYRDANRGKEAARKRQRKAEARAANGHQVQVPVPAEAAADIKPVGDPMEARKEKIKAAFDRVMHREG